MSRFKILEQRLVSRTRSLANDNTIWVNGNHVTNKITLQQNEDVVELDIDQLKQLIRILNEQFG